MTTIKDDIKQLRQMALESNNNMHKSWYLLFKILNKIANEIEKR